MTCLGCSDLCLVQILLHIQFFFVLYWGVVCMCHKFLSLKKKFSYLSPSFFKGWNYAFFGRASFVHVTIRHIWILTFKGFHSISQFRLGVRMYRLVSQRSHGIIASSVLHWTSLIIPSMTNTERDSAKERVLLSLPVSCAVSVPAGHLASSFGSVRCCPLWNLQRWRRAGSWQKLHLHPSASSPFLASAFCTDSRLYPTDNL